MTIGINILPFAVQLYPETLNDMYAQMPRFGFSKLEKDKSGYKRHCPSIVSPIYVKHVYIC